MHTDSKKIIKAHLTKNENNEIVIRFIFDENGYDLNLQSNDSENIKNVFIELSKQIRKHAIEVNLEIEDTMDSKKDALFIDASKEYISQLNTELLALENDEDLKIIREF